MRDNFMLGNRRSRRAPDFREGVLDRGDRGSAHLDSGVAPCRDIRATRMSTAGPTPLRRCACASQIDAPMPAQFNASSAG
jgi:hypothetical protein